MTKEMVKEFLFVCVCERFDTAEFFARRASVSIELHGITMLSVCAGGRIGHLAYIHELYGIMT